MRRFLSTAAKAPVVENVHRQQMTQRQRELQRAADDAGRLQQLLKKTEDNLSKIASTSTTRHVNKRRDESPSPTLAGQLIKARQFDDPEAKSILDPNPSPSAPVTASESRPSFPKFGTPSLSTRPGFPPRQRSSTQRVRTSERQPKPDFAPPGTGRLRPPRPQTGTSNSSRAPRSRQQGGRRTSGRDDARFGRPRELDESPEDDLGPPPKYAPYPEPVTLESLLSAQSSRQRQRQRQQQRAPPSDSLSTLPAGQQGGGPIEAVSSLLARNATIKPKDKQRLLTTVQSMLTSK